MNVRFGGMAGMLAAALLVAPAAFAQGAGQWAVKLGAARITPQVESGDVSAPALPGTRSDVGPDTRPTFALSYSWTENVVFELHLGLPFRHKIYGTGAVEGVGQLASVKALPPTALVQYRLFEPEARLRPYVGLGATYVYFDDETGSGRLTAMTNIGGPPTTFSIEHKLGAIAAIGLIYNINQRWFADVFASKTWLKTNVAYSSGQTQQITLNPQAVGVSVGYRF